MITQYVNKLIDNLPDEMKNKKTPLRLDVVLDGGAFNGSYLLGSLFFLKEMERRNYIIIERISGCSIGSLAGLLYLSDSLDVSIQLYRDIYEHFNEHHNLSKISDLKSLLGNHLLKDICEKVNNKLFINYNNVLNRKKYIKSVFKNSDDLLNTICKSCYIPIITNGNMLYKHKNIDGINPYIFNIVPNKKILYINLIGYDKLGHLLNVKNEKTNFHRILTGLLDIHNFYIKQSNTTMCSYVNDWGITSKFVSYTRTIIERVIVYILYFIIQLKQKLIPYFNIEDTLLYKICIKISYDIFIILIDNYCL
jgi:hypothetical protein